jgi:1-acyl-sn-glycerol-3-phosphate acyltransferase
MTHGGHERTSARESPIWLEPLVDTIDATVKANLRERPFQRDARIVRRTLPLIEVINRYFGAEIRGWEHVPTQGPMLIVGNHSGGVQTIDVAPLLERWIKDRGPRTPLYILGYDLLFAFPIVGPWWRKLGMLRADPVVARTALDRGATAVVFPGGDYEVFRPWSERNRIDFGGHTGFVKLAIAARVPVVPMTIHGAHESTIVLARGHRIAHWMGLERLRIKVFPLIWNIPLGVTPAFVPSLQLPAKVTVQFGRPLDWTHYPPRKATDPRVVRRCYEEISGVMQRTLAALAREHPHPVLGRLNALRPSRLVRRLLGGKSDSADNVRRTSDAHRRGAVPKGTASDKTRAAAGDHPAPMRPHLRAGHVHRQPPPDPTGPSSRAAARSVVAHHAAAAACVGAHQAPSCTRSPPE